MALAAALLAVVIGKAAYSLVKMGMQTDNLLNYWHYFVVPSVARTSIIKNTPLINRMKKSR